jgi:hypothetical protein
VKQATLPSQDEVVAAVLSRASNLPRVKQLVTRFVAAIGDPYDAGFDEVDAGGFVSRKELKTIYNVYDELWPLQGRVSARRLKALDEGAKLTSAEKTVYTRRRLVTYFAEPIEGACYAIAAVTSSSGRTAYWVEIREGDSWEGVRRKTIGMFRSVAAGKAALRRKGLISARDYRPAATRRSEASR